MKCTTFQSDLIARWPNDEIQNHAFSLGHQSSYYGIIKEREVTLKSYVENITIWLIGVKQTDNIVRNFSPNPNLYARTTNDCNKKFNFFVIRHFNCGIPEPSFTAMLPKSQTMNPSPLCGEMGSFQITVRTFSFGLKSGLSFSSQLVWDLEIYTFFIGN